MAKKWTRPEKLSLWGIIVVTIVGILSIISIDIRFIKSNIKRLTAEVAEIKNLKAEEIEAGIYRLPNGYCIFEDKSTTTPNFTIGKCPDDISDFDTFIKIYKRGATTTLGF